MVKSFALLRKMQIKLGANHIARFRRRSHSERSEESRESSLGQHHSCTTNTVIPTEVRSPQRTNAVEGPAVLSRNQKPTAGFSTRILRLLARNDRDFYAEIASRNGLFE